MKTNLLALTPKEFCCATDACVDVAKFALKHTTMADVWDHCPRVDWLCWILTRLAVSPDERVTRLFMVWCARNTPLPDGRTLGDLLTDPRSIAALRAAEAFARGELSREELSAAESAAWSAAAESAAWSAAESAAWSVAESVAESVAWSAAESAARSAAWGAAESAARSAAESATRSAQIAARSAARSAQASEFRRVVPNPFRQ